ncbi:MAG: hypothetical protein ABSH56_03490 [Bryobacteraceae bacterium]|jgi:hypothetical protein
MQAILCITDPEAGDEQKQQLTRDLVRTLSRETDMTAALPEPAAAAPGSRGDPVTLGTIALTFLSGGSAVALIKVLETYFQRKSSLQVELKKPDGRALTINAENMAADQIEKTAKLAEQFSQG